MTHTNIFLLLLAVAAYVATLVFDRNSSGLTVKATRLVLACFIISYEQNISQSVDVNTSIKR